MAADSEEMDSINLQYVEIPLETSDIRPTSDPLQANSLHQGLVLRRGKVFKLILLATALSLLTKVTVKALFFHRPKGCLGQIRTPPTDKRVEDYRYGRSWQKHPGPVGAIYIKEPAYWDTRVDVGSNPVVRILSVAVVNADSIYCHFWFDESPFHFLTIASVHQTGGLTTMGRKRYSQYLYSCVVPSFLPRPTHVSIATSECGGIYTMLPISTPQTGAPQFEFGVCASLTNSLIDPHELTEWIELTHLLGVGEITIHTNILDIDQSVKDVLYYYTSKDKVKVVDVLPPMMDFTPLGGLRLVRVADFNSCLMRNMHRYEWLIGVDLDEFLIPRQPIGYPQLIKNINSRAKLNDSQHSYSFSHIFHYTDNIQEDNSAQGQEVKLKTMKFRNRQPYTMVTSQPQKSIINPRRCLSVYNHQCVISLGKTLSSMKVPPEVAGVHRYRKCTNGKQQCAAEISQSFGDDVMVRYKDELLNKVTNALNEMQETLHKNRPL